ncbi:MAG TPA: hypothetical protein VNZ45_15625, partial [Bacteroidia bacterium]|nr:hypothetical protein [Bacteroidia bacterium]
MSQIYKPVNGGSGAVLSITTDSGTVSGENLQLFAITDHADAGSSVSFSASTATEMDLNLTDIIQNTILGLSSGNKTLTGENNTAVGFQTLHALTSGVNNTAMGVNAGLSITSGTTNTLIGFEAGQSISSGGNNTVVGYDSFISATTALNNTIIGAQSGLNYTSSESNNINIGVAVPGVTGESNVTRIGSDTQATCFITGITGNTVSNQQFVTI